MAKEADIEIVRAGTDSIREYRKSHAGWDRPFDLSGADLRGLYLEGADLGGADLSRADLDRAILSDCNLSQANLTEATLTHAAFIRCRFRETVLCGANANLAAFSSCVMRRVDARGALLEGASFRGAQMVDGNWSGVDAGCADFLRADLSFSRWRDSDLSGAAMSSTILAATDLGGARGLDAVTFDGPCPIDDSTIRTIDPVSEAFLRGCGLPDDLIAFYVQVAAAPRMPTAFISYSTAQQEFADRIHADLQHAGVRTWLATEDLKGGEWFRQVIYDAIGTHDRTLLVLSQDSVTSEWVEDEVNAALARERAEGRLILLPINLDDTIWTTGQAWAQALLQKRHVGDFTRWQEPDAYAASLARLLRDLNQTEHLAHPGPSSYPP